MKKHAFSLMELMVCMALLSILGLLVVQISGAIQQTAAHGNRTIDAAAQARLALERIGLDLAGLVNRPDVDFVSAPSSTAGSDLLKMIAMVGTSDATPNFKNRNASVITYRVQAHPDNANRRCLVRGARAAGWNTSGIYGLEADGM